MNMYGHIDVAIKMKCKDCGHVQIVKGFRTHDGSRYFGSAYDFCDKCDRVPLLVEELGDIE